MVNKLRSHHDRYVSPAALTANRRDFSSPYPRRQDKAPEEQCPSGKVAPFTRADFEEALKKVSRPVRRKPSPDEASS